MQDQEVDPDSQPSQALPRAARIMAASGESATEITADFRQAASTLNTSQLVKDAYFTLFESVSALEIMDPKMDSGHLEPGEALEDQYDIMREMLPEEVLGIMDQMLCYEMAWHMGHPLSQGLFTSFYLDRMLWPEPKTLDEARFDRDHRTSPGNELVHLVLRSYSLTLVKTCDFVHRTIAREHHYEEEDFVTNLYHRNLLTDFEVTEIINNANQVMQWLDATSCICDSLREALAIRLEFRKAMLTAVDIGSGFSGRANSWRKCSQLLPTIQKSGSLGLPVKAAFSAKIQRRLASSVPPRPIVETSFSDALSFLGHICTRGLEAFGLLRCRTASSAMNFMSLIQSRSPQPPVYVRCLLQSLVLHEREVLEGIPVKTFLFDSMAEISLPASILLDSANENVEAPQDPRFQINARMDTMLARCSDAFIDVFRAICMNRSRMRRMLCHLIIDWDNIQLDAEALDIELREFTKERPVVDPREPTAEIWSYPLSSWAYYLKLLQMEWIVSLGFELDVYGIGELGGMYWYLQHLTSTRLHHLERLRTFVDRRLEGISKPTKSQEAAYSRCCAFIDFAELETSAVQCFALSLSCLFSFLAHVSVLPHCYEPSQYSSAPLRHALRMKPFISLSIPEVPSYADFAARAGLPSDHEESRDTLLRGSKSSKKWRQRAHRLIEDSSQALKNARKLWEAISKSSPLQAQTVECEEWWRVDTKNVLRSCIAASISIEQAAKAINGAEGEQSTMMKDALKIDIPEPGKAYHPWWIIPKITSLPNPK